MTTNHVAEKAYNEAIDLAWKAYQEAITESGIL